MIRSLVRIFEIRPVLFFLLAVLSAWTASFVPSGNNLCFASTHKHKSLAVVDTAGQKESGKPLLMWKVSNGKNSAYLLGSIHLVKPDFYPLPSAIEKAFQKSDELVLEIDESKSPPGAIDTLSMELGMYPSTDSIENHISPETLKALNNYLKTNQVSIPISRMRPWLACLMIQNLELQKVGFAKGIDAHFADAAKSLGKETDQVESADFQIKLLSGFSDDLQDKILSASLKDINDTEKDAGSIVKAWKDGSPEQMDLAVTKDERDHPELKEFWETTVYERNDGMAKKIEEYLNSGKHCFIAVGAAHLVGKRGLVQLLKDRKLTVEQVYSGGE